MGARLLDRRLARAVALALILGAALPAQRVVLISLDGLGHQILTTDPVAQQLTYLQTMRQRGTMFDGVQPHFPSTTANSHAAIWTGVYGDVNGITYNSHPLIPREAHKFTDREVGFRSTQLQAEPIWVTAARQGKTVVAYQATQMYPFTSGNTHKGAVAANGYQTRTIAPYQVIEKPSRWESGSFEFTARPSGDGLRVCVVQGGCVLVSRKGGFSAPLLLPGNLPLAAHYRLFGEKLLQTQIQELGLHDGERRNDSIVRAMVASEGAFVPNGAAQLFAAGSLTAEEYLETVEFQIRQATRHARWLNRRFRPHLMIAYLPFPDETDHKWLGLDRAGDAQAREYRTRVYRALETAARQLGAMAGSGDTLIFASDHGMTPFRRTLNVGAVLRKAGLADRVAPLYYSVLVNSNDWKQGLPGSREEVLVRFQEALAAVRDPDTGEAVVTGFFTPAEHGERYGIGGPASGDLYYDVLPGYMAGNLKNDDAIVETEPGGTHGFLPTRADMLAFCIARGPRFRAGETMPRIRSIQIAPMISEILGIGPPRDARGKSPLQ
jgi:hypothetical protein